MAVDTAGNQSEVVTEIYIIGDLVTDTDEDGMPDGWEVTYGLNPLVDDASEDPDGDGLTNLEEYDLGRHPQNAEPDKPILSLPGDGETEVSLTPELETGSFSDRDGDGHAATEWQISTVEGDFTESSLVLSATCDSHLMSLRVPEFILAVDTVYYWRVRFHDDRNAASEWSEVFSFTTIEASASDDPDQDGVPDEQEIKDATVDLDGNGTPDIDQSDMKCVNTVIGDAQVAVKQGTNVVFIDSLMSIDPAAIADTQNKPDEMPIGLISFKLTVDNPGDIAKVTVYLSEPAATDAKWHKYDTVSGWREYPYATFSPDGTYVTLALKDGDYGDADGVANGIIVDPSGPGTGPGGGGGCFIGVVSF